MFVGGSLSPSIEYPRTEPVDVFVKLDSEPSLPELPTMEPGSVYPENPLDAGPLYRLEISDPNPAAQAGVPSAMERATYERPAPVLEEAAEPAVSEAKKGAPMEPKEPCQTCAERQYVDGSDDTGVSYQVPTKISPSVAALKVAAHEREHVFNERADAEREGKEILNQTVTLKYATCPECGSIHVAGGVTKTTTSKEAEQAYGKFKSNDEESQKPRELSA